MVASTTDKQEVNLRLEAGGFAGAMVLHCDTRIFVHGQQGTLFDIAAEVLPSADRMVVDLAGVDRIDDQALGELVLTHLWAKESGYTLKFAGAKKLIRELFETTRLESVLEVYSSVPEAIAAMVQEDAQSA